MSFDTKEKLIQAARRLFARVGFDGTSVKDICQAAGVNVSLISYHFSGKEGLYHACLDSFGKGRADKAREMLATPKSKEELRLRLEMFLNEVLLVHTEQPDISRIVHREIARDSDFARALFQKTFQQIFLELVRFFTEAIAGGLLRSDLDPMLSATTIIGSMVHLSMTDNVRKEFFKLSLEDANFRKHAAEHTARIFLEGAFSK